LAFAAVLCAAAADTIREPETGKSFDAEIKGVTPGVTLTCTGVGCRKKTVFAAKVYAIALWVDAQGARTALSEWRAKSGEDLVADQRFYDAKLSPAAEQFLALFTTDVQKGQSIELRSLPGGVIEVVQNSATLARLPADRELATAVWAIYFHEKLADDYLEALKPKLVARIDAVW
jgi:hypothetical protein